MAKRRKELADLSGSEWAVMKALWEAREMAAGEVYGVLAQERDWAYPTVRTLLRRLVAKGWVDVYPGKLDHKPIWLSTLDCREVDVSPCFPL